MIFDSRHLFNNKNYYNFIYFNFHPIFLYIFNCPGEISRILLIHFESGSIIFLSQSDRLDIES
jgi:hypothetical protein